MKYSKSFKRNFKIGETVRLMDGNMPMRVLKYDDKLSEESGKHIVCLTWQEKGTYNIARFDETDLMPFFEVLVKK